ncbi:MAG: hypothetical protein Q4G60_04590 [bacterium]|nr:hypothetical protein [bacterium]
MKVEHTSIYIGDDTKALRHGKADKRGGSTTIFAGNSALAQDDPITKKREEARKKAMKVVGDAFAGEQKIDNDLADRKSHIDELRDNMNQAQAAMNQIDKEKDQLRESKGIAADSEEQKDLELLEKRSASMRVGSEVSLTKEEQERLEQIDAKGMTEYQKQAMEMEGYKSPYRKEISDSKKQIVEENAIIRGVKLERLKSNPMLDATQEADSIMEAADDEIMGMLIQEGRDFIDEKHKEEEEAAKKKAEEEKEKEEQIEAIREDKKEQKERVEKNKTEALTEQVLDLDQAQTDVKAEVSDIVDKMNLVIEDIKGSVVDQQV